MYKLALGRSPDQRELEAGLKFVSQGAEPPPVAEPGVPLAVWNRAARCRERNESRSFTPFAVFLSDRWQGGTMPAPHGGRPRCERSGGEPGERPEEAVVRRWTSPVSGALSIEGTLRHGRPAVPYGDGVRGHIVSSRQGELILVDEWIQRRDETQRNSNTKTRS